MEAFGGGVAVAVEDFARNTPGIDHHLLFSRRSNAPIGSPLDPFARKQELVDGHIARIRQIREYLKSLPAAVVHAHSSFAGAYVRLAVSKRSRRVVYSPHCFAFERTDLSTVMRAAYWFVEAGLSLNTSVIAACSAREAQLGAALVGHPLAVHVPNIPPRDLRDVHLPQTFNGLVGSGRLEPQKDPHFFAEAARKILAIDEFAEATWIGGGDASVQRLLEDSGVKVTGWLPRRDALQIVAASRLYLHSAAWEGFPIALLEAAALHVPIAVRDIPAFAGVGLPNIIRFPDELIEIWASMGSDEGRQKSINQAKQALSEMDSTSQGERLAEAYGKKLA